MRRIQTVPVSPREPKVALRGCIEASPGSLYPHPAMKKLLGITSQQFEKHF